MIIIDGGIMHLVSEARSRLCAVSPTLAPVLAAVPQMVVVQWVWVRPRQGLAHIAEHNCGDY